MISGSWPKSWIATGPSSGCTTSSSFSVLRVPVVDGEARDHLADRQPGAVALGLQAHEPVADPGQRREHHAVGDRQVPDRPWVVQGAHGFEGRSPASAGSAGDPVGQLVEARPPRRPRGASSRPSPTHVRIGAAREQRLRRASRCPPWHAAQNACVTSPAAASGSPSAAAASSVGRAPRSTSRRAAFHCPNAHASSKAVPPPITAPVASTSAPASSSASTSSTSSARGRPHQRRLARVPRSARSRPRRPRPAARTSRARAAGAPASPSARAAACGCPSGRAVARAGSAASAARRPSTSPSMTSCAPR